ncbi:MAG TPA: hypothetical protein VFD84_14585 [Candidatus Binatia bacterium]|nr:hypothetical protein [Candidatus Binatia bacterium]
MRHPRGGDAEAACDGGRQRVRLVEAFRGEPDLELADQRASSRPGEGRLATRAAFGAAIASRPAGSPWRLGRPLTLALEGEDDAAGARRPR